MQKNQKGNNNGLKSVAFTGTDPQKVKQDIQRDLAQGEGAMTSREAGGMRD